MSEDLAQYITENNQEIKAPNFEDQQKFFVCPEFECNKYEICEYAG